MMRLLYLGIVLFMFSCPILPELASENEVSNNKEQNLLKATFNDDLCTNPCWSGIEVGVSNRQAVEEFLSNEGLDYATDGDYTYHVSLENDSPLWNGVLSPIADIHVGDTDKVYAMSFFLNLCPSTVIEAYDEYPEVEQTNGEILYLLYPTHGLTYWLNLETERVVVVFLFSLEHFTDLDVETQAWSDVADNFVGDCVDALSQ